MRNANVKYVEPNLAAARVGSSADLEAQARETIEAMVALAPAAHRAIMRRDLEDPQRSAGFAGSTDPEMARLGAILAGIRAHQIAAAAGQSNLSIDDGLQVRVTVALVSSLPDTDVRARVLRRPGDSGNPILLVRESDVTARDIAAGLRAAAISVQRQGSNVAKEHYVDVRASTKPSRTSRVNSQYVQHLRSSLPVAIPGIGVVKATVILAPLR